MRNPVDNAARATTRRGAIAAIALLLSSPLSAQIIGGRHRGIFTPSAPAISLITQAGPTTGTGSGGDVDLTIDSTGANLLVFTVSWYYPNGTNSAIYDSKFNTWTCLTHYGSTYATQICYATNVSGKVGSSHTVHTDFQGAGGATGVTYPIAALYAYSGAHATAPFDSGTDVGNPGGAASTCQPGSITPGGDNRVIVTSYANDLAAAATINSGFSSPIAHGEAAADYVGGGAAYLIQTTGGAVNPTWTGGGSAGNFACAIAAFKP